MNEKIMQILRECGVPAHVNGYNYIKSAIKRCIDDKNILVRGVTKELYPALAKEFGSTASRVERGIRHAIEISFNNMRPVTIDKLFGNSVSYSRGKATNAQFIATLAEYLRQEVATV